MGTYCVEWRVGKSDFKLLIDASNPDVMTLTRGNSLPHFFSRAEAYALARQITKNFNDIGRRELLKAEDELNRRKSRRQS